MLDGFMSLLGQTATATVSPTPVEYRDALITVWVGGGMLVTIVAIVFGTLSGVAKRKSFEESRREIAAYVAEGTMSPKDAEQILKTGKNIG